MLSEQFTGLFESSRFGRQAIEVFNYFVGDGSTNERCSLWFSEASNSIEVILQRTLFVLSELGIRNPGWQIGAWGLHD
jgi:hypothetical protein